jgi:t-SNARE complex subunit (syntaxin)
MLSIGNMDKRKGRQWNSTTKISKLLAYIIIIIIIIIITAILLSLGGSSSNTGTEKINKNKYT